MECCICIKCNKVMKNFADKGLQPIGGLAFITRGHYGSAYFDPMPEFSDKPDYLEITVCDGCVKQAEKDGFVYRGLSHIAGDSDGRFVQ